MAANITKSIRAEVQYVDKQFAPGSKTETVDIYELAVKTMENGANQLRDAMNAAQGGSIMISATPASQLPAAPPKREPVKKAPTAEVCEEHGLESHDNEKGGALTAAHIKHLDAKTFSNGLHKPNFHPEGMHKEVVSGDKKFETGFHYLLHCHELGGKNPDGGFGGPLCKDPYGAEVRGIVDRLLKEADEDKTLCYNNFTDPCPQLTKEQVALCKGFDYGDKTKKLPMGSIPWPTGLPEPGYVPKTDPLHGRWITVSGGQKAFIKAAIEAGMLGKAEANKIVADTDHHQTGGMYLRINQFGDVCTVDASVAKFARAKRTWKSGHYFYEPLVSGGNLLGVWVLPEEYRKIGFFWEMESGRCFRIERRAFPAGPYMFLRQATEVNGKISFVFYVKVDDDPGSAPIPVQSRDYTALAGCDNVADNLGNPYACTAKDLDYPVKRDTWLDQNEKEMLFQRKKVANTFAKISDQDFIGMGWTSENLTGVSLDGLWEALVYKARNPAEVMDVSDVVVQDRKGFLWRSMFVNAQQKKVVEHIYCNERKGEMVYRVVDNESKRESDDERVIAIKEDPLRMEFFHRHKSDGYRSYWPAPTKVVAGMVAECVKLGQKLEQANSDKVGLGCHSEVIAAASHDAMWKAMMECVREPGRFMKDCSVAEMKNCEGFVQRTLMVLGKRQPTENIYSYEANCEVVYRVLDQWGKETAIERVIALRSHPLQLEFHCRNRMDGFRVDWKAPKTVVMGLCDALVAEAKRMESDKPTMIGYGATSDPISSVSYDSLMIGIEKTVMDPTLTGDIAPGTIKIQEFEGFIKRQYKLRAGNELVQEKVTIFEEVGEIVFCKLNDDGSDGKFERVIALHTGPLRMELYERDTTNDVRCAWREPYASAAGYFGRIVEIAQGVEKAAKDVIGYGLASKPITGMSPDSMWKSMLYCVRNPANAGMNVSNVSITDKAGYMVRTMSLNDQGGKTTSDNIYVDERAQEIIYRPTTNGREGDDERVFATRNNPLRMEMFSRHVKDRMRTHWKAPRGVATLIFKEVTSMGQLMHNDPRAFDQRYGRPVAVQTKPVTVPSSGGYAF